jgi:hypothetical protein
MIFINTRHARLARLASSLTVVFQTRIGTNEKKCSMSWI